MTNEEMVLAIKAGNTALMEQLWKQCYKFVRLQADKWIKKSNRTDIDADDLIQCGYLALCDAVKGFDAERGIFINYLGYRIGSRFQAALTCKTTSKREPLYGAARLDSFVMNDSDSMTLGELIPDKENGIEEAEERINKEQLAQIVRKAVFKLPENKAFPIAKHYLLGITYDEIAEEYGVTKQAIQDRCIRGLDDLRKGRNSRILFELFNEYEYIPTSEYRKTGFNAWKKSDCSIQERIMLEKENLENMIV